MNKKIILVLLSIFIVAVVAGSAIAAEAKVNTEIKMLSEKTLKNGDDIEFQLKDAQGKEIASQKVNISFEANGKYENYSVITDEHGNGYLVLYNEALGDHKVIINYTGNNKYNPCKLEETIKIVEGKSTNDKTNANLYDERWEIARHYPFVDEDKQKRTCAKALVMTHAYSNAIMDKVEEAVKNGVVGNEDDDW